MRASTTEKFLITKSNDGCVVAISSDKKTNPTDVFIGKTTMQKNISNGTFVKHSTLTFNDKPLYVYSEDL